MFEMFSKFFKRVKKPVSNAALPPLSEVQNYDSELTDSNANMMCGEGNILKGHFFTQHMDSGIAENERNIALLLEKQAAAPPMNRFAQTEDFRNFSATFNAERRPNQFTMNIDQDLVKGHTNTNVNTQQRSKQPMKSSIDTLFPGIHTSVS